MRERGLEAQEQRPLFVGTHGERLTRFGATHIVRRAVATATMIDLNWHANPCRRMS